MKGFLFTRRKPRETHIEPGPWSGTIVGEPVISTVIEVMVRSQNTGENLVPHFSRGGFEVLDFYPFSPVTEGIFFLLRQKSFSSWQTTRPSFLSTDDVSSLLIIVIIDDVDRYRYYDSCLWIKFSQRIILKGYFWVRCKNRTVLKSVGRNGIDVLGLLFWSRRQTLITRTLKVSPPKGHID